MPKRAMLEYARQVWTVVVFRMLIDVTAALFLVTVIGLLAAGLVLLAGATLGVTQQHIRSATAILGSIYVVVIFARALRRHWIVAGHVTRLQGVAEQGNLQSPAREEPTTEAVEVQEEANAQRSTSSN